MRRILGIDAGGTYTDGVVLTLPDGRVAAKTKTPTTRDDLCACIRNCIGAFPADTLHALSQVCLSTTLATNALVEGHGCTEGLLLIGGRPEGRLPTELVQQLAGKPDILGRIREPLDVTRVDEAIETMRGRVQAVAVSGYASVRNPAHEQFVSARVRELLNVPTACAHELTGALGFYDRTVTVALNARLIPLLCRLIDAVQRVLAEFAITAPLMIVRGDGSLMTATEACKRPIETVLSGPAASIAGGLFLSGERDAFVLDMGGTTTDLAHLTDGAPRLRTDGANVGGWFTRVRADEVYTVGLGGDSRLRMDDHGTLLIGPERAVPYCVAATQYPALVDELHAIRNDPTQPYLQFQQQDAEAFLISSPRAAADNGEEVLFSALADAPHTLHKLRSLTELPDLAMRTDLLVREGVLLRVALTPTDLLHTEGSYTQWNTEASSLAIALLAARLELSSDACVNRLRQALQQKITRTCLEAAFYFDGQLPAARGASFPRYFTDLLQGGSTLLQAPPTLNKCIVAIGAPAAAWVGCLQDSLHTNVVFPTHGEVAGAAGAAAGHVLERADALIRRDPITQQFAVFTTAARQVFSTLEQATTFARAESSRLAQARLPESPVDVTVYVKDTTVDDGTGTPPVLAERRVYAVAARCFSDCE